MLSPQAERDSEATDEMRSSGTKHSGKQQQHFQADMEDHGSRQGPDTPVEGLDKPVEDQDTQMEGQESCDKGNEHQQQNQEEPQQVDAHEESIAKEPTHSSKQRKHRKLLKSFEISQR